MSLTTLQTCDGCGDQKEIVMSYDKPTTNELPYSVRVFSYGTHKDQTKKVELDLCAKCHETIWPKLMSALKNGTSGGQS